MKLLFQEDDCAPDAAEHFRIVFERLTGVNVVDFMADSHIEHDDLDIFYELGKYRLAWSQDDPFYRLYEV